MTLTTHTYKGFKIERHGDWYKGKKGKTFLFACTWWKVEQMIDEILKSKNN